jgi:hypothetical protein
MNAHRTMYGCAAALLALGLMPHAVAAQDTPPTAWGRGTHASGNVSPDIAAVWLGAWSPLRPIVESPRGLLRAPLAPGLLDAPPPPSGAFVLAGAPGSLPRDFTRRSDSARFGEVRVRSGSESGTFRRPLDVSHSSVTQAFGQGYAPVGRRLVAIGRFLVDQERNAPGSYTARVQPYVSFPVVTTDTMVPPMQRSRARLEGALGLRLGEFGVGVSAGIESREHLSVNVPLRRSGRAATPAANVGIERVLPWLDLRVGGFFRWSEANESNLLRPNPGSTIAYPLRALDEPFGLQVVPGPGGGGGRFVRTERRATAAGGTASAMLLGVDVVIVHEQGNLAEEETATPFNRIRLDLERWRAEGSETRLLAQRRIVRGVTATVVAAMESLDGRGRRAELDGIAYVGSHTRRAVEVDLRTATTGRWSAALLGGVVQNERALEDFVAELQLVSDVRTPFIGAEVGRRFGRAAVAAGVSMASMTPTRARIPAAAERGERYQLLIAPALAYEVAEATAMAGWLTTELPVRKVTLLGSVRGERASPRSVAAQRLQPGGERTGWSVVLGIRP